MEVNVIAFAVFAIFTWELGTCTTGKLCPNLQSVFFLCSLFCNELLCFYRFTLLSFHVLWIMCEWVCMFLLLSFRFCSLMFFFPYSVIVCYIFCVFDDFVCFFFCSRFSWLSAYSFRHYINSILRFFLVYFNFFIRRIYCNILWSVYFLIVFHSSCLDWLVFLCPPKCL